MFIREGRVGRTNQKKQGLWLLEVMRRARSVGVLLYGSW